MSKTTIIVTGAASGLGAAICRALNENHAEFFEGLEVIEYDTAINEDMDVSCPITGVDGCIYGLGLEGRPIDVLINCAGVNHNDWFEDVDEPQLELLMDVNAFGIVRMTQACLAGLKLAKGTVINIVSNAARIPMTSSLAYNMSKAAALMATKQMAHELTPRHGITVFSVSPNKLAGTGMSASIEENVQRVRGWTPEYAAEYQKKALMHGQETDPDAVADFIASLIYTGQAKFMSGCDIPFGK